MKYIILLLSTLFPCFCFAQILGSEKAEYDTVLELNLSKMVLADHQYFNLNHPDYIVLFTVAPESALKNKDSLLKESRYLNREILKNAGSSIGNKQVDIAFIGTQSDKENISFNFVNNQFRGRTFYQFPDTLLAPDQSVISRLEYLGWSTYVRHSKEDNSLSISFKVITKLPEESLTTASCEKLAIGFIVDYIGDSYRHYSMIEIEYFDQYGRYHLLYKAYLDVLILRYLNNYYRAYLKTKRENKADSNLKYLRPTIHTAPVY